MTQNILEMRDIDKGFNGVPVLKHVNLDVRSGEVHALCGENGAGKSTLVTCVAQLRRYLGEVTFEGHRGRDLRGMIGYMPQGLPGDAALTALE